MHGTARPEPLPPASAARCDTALMLERLRIAAMESRLAPRSQPERTLASVERAAELEFDALARGLLGLLPEALGRRVVLHRPGARSRTFDEAWLMRMIGASAEAATDDLAFNIAARVRRHMRPQIRSLTVGLARHLDA